MVMIKVPKGQRFIRRGEKMNNLFLIVQGKVRQVSERDMIFLENGNLIGIIECMDGIYINDYYAEQETVLYPFSFEKIADFQAIFESQPKYAGAFLQAAVRQTVGLQERYQKLGAFTKKFYLTMMELYQDYQNYCEQFQIEAKEPKRMDSLEKIKVQQELGEWEIRYFHELNQMKAEDLYAFYGARIPLVIGEIARAADNMRHAEQLIDRMQEYIQLHKDVLFGASAEDLFGSYVDLAVELAGQDQNVDGLLKKIDAIRSYIEETQLYDAAMMRKRFDAYTQIDFAAIRSQAQELSEAQENEEEAQDCLASILSYAEYDEEAIEKVRETFENYRTAEENSATEDALRRIRRELTGIFYDAYKKAFRRSVEDEELSPIIQMFLYYGFMDVQTAGEDTANTLLDLTEQMYRCKSEHVYTMYDWLLAIYRGEQEPCRNEFDLDYIGYLHEQKRLGKITADQEVQMKHDNWEKVCYEMDNMFVSTNRATYGRISTFCPVLNRNDVVGTIEKMLVTVHKLEKAMNMIKNIDFSLFFHEVIFSDPDKGVNKELLNKEILPDIILMPNIGTRAMMWQETAGMKRDTSARFVFPLFTINNLEDMMIETCGRYRWEMCRKIQGMRWNDITERSLTSEYCDYIQFYRKNHDLSMEAKEKIKNALTRAKNNYREVFVADYMNWIKYESNGSFRLNRVAREILFRYCPFCKDIRESLAQNPTYQDMFSRYRILVARKQKHAQVFTDKYIKSGGEMSVELQENLEFYNM